MAKTVSERRRRWLGWLGQGLLVVAVVAAIQWWQSRDLVSDRAPDLLGLSLDGQPYRLDAAQGPHLVYFWANWCPVCRVQHGGIASVAGSYPVVTVATTSGGADAVATYLAERGTPDLRVVLDDDGRIGRQWGVAGVPAVFIVGRDRQIHYAGVGYSTSIGLRLRLWLASLRDGGGRAAGGDPAAGAALVAQAASDPR